MSYLKTLLREFSIVLISLQVIFCYLLSHFKSLSYKKNNSVFFIGNNYNTFYNLAESLKKRGWKAISLNPYKDCQFIETYHLFADLSSPKDSIKIFLNIIFNYKFLHLYNRTTEAIYTGPSRVLKSLLTVKNLKRFGVIVIFTPSGCLDGSTSKEINEITNGLCEKCIWQGNNRVCNDFKNQEKIDWIRKNCDLFSNEVDLPKKISQTNIGLNIPIHPLNSEVLMPKLIAPNQHKISKNNNEIIVFTAYGNQNIRSDDKKDIKGIKYIMSAINKLISEGHPIKHFHATNIPIKNMRYYQVQADIIIDQLNYGSIGSAAREGMMLAKPVICHISDLIRNTNIAMRDCPAVNATENTIYEALKNLVSSKEERLFIGTQSRKWMLKWFDADVCAERYEKIANRLINKLPLHPESRFL